MGMIDRTDWLEAQNGVLGSALISPEVVPMILSQTSEADYSGKNLALFQAIRHLFSAGEPVDVITLRDQLGADSSAYLMQLMEITPTAANVQAYIELCRRQSKTCRLRELGQQMADAESAEDLEALLSQANALACDRPGFHAVSMREAVDDFLARHTGSTGPDYLKWPIPGMDERLFVENGDFVIIGGKPSAGKTAFALQCAWHMAETKRVGFFSLETGPKKLTDRLISLITGVPMENIKRNALNETHLSAAQDMKTRIVGRSLELLPLSRLSVADVQALSAANRYDVVFIDYLQILMSPGNSSYERVTNQSLDLHRFSQSSGCCVIALSQLSRDGQNDKSAPDMSSLRNSGQLEQDADVVLLLSLNKPGDAKSQRVLKCAKNKEGEWFRILLDFDGKTQRFSKATDFSGVHSELRRMAREQKQYERMQQMTILPADTPVPFEGE